MHVASDMSAQILRRALAPSAAQTSEPTTELKNAAGGSEDDFGKDLESSGLIGLSSYNPGNADNNCVFVTLAYLLGLKSVNELNNQVKAFFPPPTARGIAPCTILTVLEKTGYEFKRISWSEEMTELISPASGNMVWRAQEQMFKEWNTTQIGILFTWPDGNGHCIVAKKTSFGSEYVCFQTQFQGVDMSEDIKTTEWDGWNTQAMTFKKWAAGQGARCRVVGAFAVSKAAFATGKSTFVSAGSGVKYRDF